MKKRILASVVVVVFPVMLATPAQAAEPLEEAEVLVNAVVCAAVTATDDKNLKDEPEELRPCLTRPY